MDTTRALIYTQNLHHNLREIKSHLAPGVKMCVAVKADGYGHGSVLTSRVAVQEGADFLAVARVEEGIELRKAGITARILLLSLCAPDEFPDLFKYNITPFIFGAEHIKALSDAAADWYAAPQTAFSDCETAPQTASTDNITPRLPKTAFPDTEPISCSDTKPFGQTPCATQTAFPDTKPLGQTPSPPCAPQTASPDGNTKFNVHLAVDTGMGRIGCLPSEAAHQAELIESSPNLALEGMGTHFAVSDSLSGENVAFTEKQFADFKFAIEEVKSAGIEPEICHAGASAVVLARPDFHLDMVRPGIITYGYYPDEITREYLASRNIHLDLKPVMQFETKVSAIRRFAKGQSVSYGRTWKAQGDTDIAVLPVGYADGLLRRFSPGLKVAINGKEYPVAGRICMDQCMVDIGKDNKEVRVWDTAVIFGPTAPQTAFPDSNTAPQTASQDTEPLGQTPSAALQTAESLAYLGNTISYEVLTTIGKRVKRIER